MFKRLSIFSLTFTLLLGLSLNTYNVSSASSDELIENGGFENGKTPWIKNGSANVATTNKICNNGKNSLAVTSRTQTSDGPKQVITGKVKAGTTYKFSAKVRYDASTAPTEKQFNFDIQNGSSVSGIKILGSQTIKKGEWNTIEGTYTLPKDADISQTSIFLETTWKATPDKTSDLMDFYVDDVSFSEQSTSTESSQSTSTQATSAFAKIPGYSNPLITQKFGADPYALVYNGRVYVYMSSDQYEYDSSGNIINNTYDKINKITVISSDDMVNWTDHGEISVAGSSGVAKWAGHSWAPAVAHKVINGKDKFFLYFANSAGSIGVLTGDSPIGPWTDPLGQPMITSSTSGVSGVVWLFDPAVLVDDDGNGYLYFGGGIPGNNSPTQSQIANPKTSRVIKLNSDMIHTVGSASVIDAPFMFEDSGIHKYNGKYYYSYCSNFAGTHPTGTPPKGEIAYMVSDNPMGPFTYKGTFLKNPGTFFGVGGNNHHAVFQFKNQWYVTYHAQTLGKAMGITKGYRSPHINKLECNSNGLINNVKADMQGVSQVANLNPYIRTEAETIGWNGGISTEKCQAPGSMVKSVNLDVTNINNGDWIAVSNANFGNGAKTFKANVASTVGGKIEIHLDSIDGDVIGTLDVNSTGGEQQWKEMQCNVKSVSGVHNIFLKFTGNSTKNLFNIDYWQFNS